MFQFPLHPTPEQCCSFSIPKLHCYLVSFAGQCVCRLGGRVRGGRLLYEEVGSLQVVVIICKSVPLALAGVVNEKSQVEVHSVLKSKCSVSVNE